MALSAASASAASVITVDAGGGANYTTIQDAVNNAVSGDEIDVAAGTYEVTSELDVNTPVSIVGQGTGAAGLTPSTAYMVVGLVLVLTAAGVYIQYNQRKKK